MTLPDATAFTCVNHPRRETRVTCSNCGDPICPSCMVVSPVGQKCPRCARQPSRARGIPSPLVVLRGLGAGIAVAVLGGLVLLRSPLGGSIVISALYGAAVGAAIRFAANRRVHAVLGAAGALSVVVGLAAVAIGLGAGLLGGGLVLTYVIAACVAAVVAGGGR